MARLSAAATGGRDHPNLPNLQYRCRLAEAICCPLCLLSEGADGAVTRHAAQDARSGSPRRRKGAAVLQGDTVKIEALVGMESEAGFQLAVCDLLDLHGWLWWHDNFSRWNKRGLPDLLALRGPRMLALELKTAKGRETPEQLGWLDALSQIPGVEARIIRPADFEALKRLIA